MNFGIYFNYFVFEVNGGGEVLFVCGSSWILYVFLNIFYPSEMQEDCNQLLRDLSCKEDIIYVNLATSFLSFCIEQCILGPLKGHLPFGFDYRWV